MAIQITSLKYASFVYDFATDGGAIGTIPMGKFLPPNSVVWFGYAKVITTFTSGGAAKISVGFVGPSNSLIFNTAFTSFTAGTIITGVDLLTIGIALTSTSQLALTISDSTITAGKLVYFVAYDAVNGNTPFPILTGIGAMVIGSTFIVG